MTDNPSGAMRVGTVYTVSGSSRENVPFSQRVYCARSGAGAVDLVGKTEEGHVFLIKGHPSHAVVPAREGFSLGDNVDCSTHPRGTSQFGVYAPYTKKL